MTPNILIVGAGIAGLTLAQALKQKSVAFDLVERAPEPAPVGAGLSLTVNATRLLDDLGFAEAIRARGHISEMGWIRSQRGNALQRLDLSALQPYGVSVALHRAELHDLLSQDLDVGYGQEVQGLEWRPGRVQVQLPGEKREYALVIAADGLRSRVRASLPGAPRPVYSGYTSWRFVTPNTPALTDPTEFWGTGRRIGLIPIGGGQLYVFATLNQPAGQVVAEAGRAPLLRKLFQSFPAPVGAVLEILNADSGVIQTDIYELRTHLWRAPNMALIGDAAHAMTPNLGQGAGMGIEDAVVLAQCLDRYGNSPEALATYEQVRQERASAIATQSRWLGVMGQLEANLLIHLRNEAMRRTPQAVTQKNVWNMMVTRAPVLKG
ncbi:2-polyprenyl-6-methoxyphenol hydroxylase [Deinococcus reticulitermitis]|uniref:2-polyprenyl-6-methoxyphenol hydroxylase n=1 Tax=Deinococcus reticulitermitis TaxID=856736 RepID=A0A1H7CVY0_9DEIO|nr:FAD-dependent monooxygenase [Deinococcus reticulitermitis]SEJ93354.1 2-polyprenyl-6-methoxyphenol hydroxylase [Deinococcus reticulitermitis]